MNEEESRDRKQSGTEGKGRWIKTRREGIGARGEKKEERNEEDETRGDCAKRRSSSRCLSREQKKKREVQGPCFRSGYRPVLSRYRRGRGGSREEGR